MWEGRVKQLGEILLDEGLVTEGQLLAALDESTARRQSLGRTLVELNILSEDQLVKALAEQVGMSFIDLDEYPVDRAAVSLVPASLCRRYTVLPVGNGTCTSASNSSGCRAVVIKPV